MKMRYVRTPCIIGLVCHILVNSRVHNSTIPTANSDESMEAGTDDEDNNNAGVAARPASNSGVASHTPSNTDVVAHAASSDTVRSSIEDIVMQTPYKRTENEKETLIKKIKELLYLPPDGRSDRDNLLQNKNRNDTLEQESVKEEHGKHVESKTHIGKKSDEDNTKKSVQIDENGDKKDGLSKKLDLSKKDDSSKKDDATKKDDNAGKKGKIVISATAKKDKVLLDSHEEHDSYAKEKKDKDEEEGESSKSDSDKSDSSDKDETLSEDLPVKEYMKKLAVDVNSVLGHATEMLRDTGKLIHGLKRVVKGASTLSSITNHAVKYVKYLSHEPTNATINFLQEKAIIALLDAEKAVNESKKAANLARIAAAKAVDVEKRLEHNEPHLQDARLIKPYIEATEILANKAEKASKLAEIEKVKNEKDFLVMNKEINKMHAKARSEIVQNSSISSPEKSSFYLKQKQLEKELLQKKSEKQKAEKEIKSHLSKVPKGEKTKEIKQLEKETKTDEEIKSIPADTKKKINKNSNKKDSSTDEISLIADELASPATTASPSLDGAVKKNSIDLTKKDSSDVTTPSLLPKEGLLLRNSSATTTNEEEATKMIDEEEKLDNLENLVLNNHDSSEVSATPEMGINKESKLSKKHEVATKREKLSNDDSIESNLRKLIKDEVFRNEIGSLAKEDKNMLVALLDQDELGSGDTSASATASGNNENNNVVTSSDNNDAIKNNLRTEKAVDKSLIPQSLSPNNLPVNASQITSKALLTPHLKIAENNSRKKSVIEDPYEMMDPFGFRSLPDSKGQYAIRGRP